MGDATPLMMTFTIRNKRQPLTDALNRLLASFRRLRQQKIWTHHITAGAAFVEVKKGANSGEWHPHLHVIALGSYIPAKELSDAWLKATGDSWRIQIERARSAADAGNYACKYASKGWTAEVVRDADALLECVLALRGRRLCQTFGRWHGVELETPDRGPEDWQRIGRLDFVHDRWLAGEPWAVGTWYALFNGDEERAEMPPAPE